METWRDELYHHGIKGQKWGVRRYQNKDGSYTAAGKKRYLTNGAAPEMTGGGGGGEMTEEERKKLEDLQKKLSLTNRKRMAEVREADRERGTPLEQKTETYTPYYFPRLNPGDYGPAADGLRGVTGRQAARHYRNLIRDDWNNLSPEDKTTYDKRLVGVEKSTEQGVPVYEIRKNVRPNYPMLSPHNLKTESKELAGRSREIKEANERVAKKTVNSSQKESTKQTTVNETKVNETKVNGITTKPITVKKEPFSQKVSRIFNKLKSDTTAATKARDLKWESADKARRFFENSDAGRLLKEKVSNVTNYYMNSKEGRTYREFVRRSNSGGHSSSLSRIKGIEKGAGHYSRSQPSMSADAYADNVFRYEDAKRRVQKSDRDHREAKYRKKEYYIRKHR